MKHNLRKSHEHHGFTLMEVMVSVSIFAIIITIGIGSLLTIFDALKKTRQDRQAIDSLSFVLDTMTRRIRTGTEYRLNGSNQIFFRDQDGQEVSFFVGNNSDDPPGVQRIFISDDEGWHDITPPSFTIDGLLFTLTGNAAGGSDGQPMVQINLAGTVGKTGSRTGSSLSVQTIVSQRMLDF